LVAGALCSRHKVALFLSLVSTKRDKIISCAICFIYLNFIARDVGRWKEMFEWQGTCDHQWQRDRISSNKIRCISE
jgi:hypothetical protein